MENRIALIAGSSGIVGGNFAEHLAAKKWKVYGLARSPKEQSGVIPIAANLLDSASIERAVKDLDVTNVFFCTWSRQSSEAENCRVNGDMLQNLFTALGGAKNLRHVSLVTGGKHYLGPFDAKIQTHAETPFREDGPRLPGENFYYTQEDILFAAAKKMGFNWNVHRPHAIVGYAMNIGVTLAVYASICKKLGEPFVFPGARFQWDALFNLTDARLLAKHLEWAAVTEKAYNHAFNITNGDLFRWRWLWQKIAEYFDVEPAPLPEKTSLLTNRMVTIGPVWKSIASEHGLVEPNLDRLASAWHTDADLTREVECVYDLSKSRALGFLEYQDSVQSFYDLFDRLRQEKVIPPGV